VNGGTIKDKKSIKKIRELKIEGGKLIRCKIEVKNGKIERILLSGDFFLYPEESITQLESGLKDLEIDDRKSIKRVITKFFRGVETVGITKEDLIKIICSF
jgi:Bacterial lipoate protein ligase C-terminus.